jgi:large subunit ribosomal protein L2
MAMIKLKPTSPGTRFVVCQPSHLWKGGPVRAPDCVSQNSRRAPQQRTAGSPRATRAAVHKHKYRIIDFRRDKDGVKGKSSASSTTRTARRTSR